MIDELGVAERIGLPTSGMSPIAIKRHIRKIYNKLGIRPLHLNRSTQLIQESVIHIIKEELCRLNLPQEKARHTGMSEGRLRGNQSLNPLEFLTEINPENRKNF